MKKWMKPVTALVLVLLAVSAFMLKGGDEADNATSPDRDRLLEE